MAQRHTIKIQGTREIDNVLKLLPQAVARRVLVPALRSGAAVLRRDIVRRAPDGPNPPHPKYGELRKNIRVTVERISSGFRAVIHTGDAFWARFIEYGTVVRTVRTRKPGRSRVMSDGKVVYGTEAGAMPAKPFFRPAFDESAPEAMKRLGERLGENLEKEAAKLAGGARQRRQR